MKIGVISYNEVDFLNHEKDSGHEYIPLWIPEMACGNKFHKIEITARGYDNPSLGFIQSYCEFRMVEIKKRIPNIRGKKYMRNDPCLCGSGKKVKNCCGKQLKGLISDK